MNNIILAPIILFVYNRPWHTEQTLKALMQNELASESTLYIYCDGAKSNATEDQKKKITEVREIVRTNQWCKEVIIVESEINKGLANSIIDGVTEVISKYGFVIVLEDDLLTSKYFLKYMNACLLFYANKKAVFSISADRPHPNLFQIPVDYNYDVFVSLRFYSTGWATWSDRWNQVDWSLGFMDTFLTNQQQIDAFNRGGSDLTDLLISQREHKIDSWAIRFDFAHFALHSVSILPCVSYIDNIGFDGSGVHSGSDDTNFRKDTTKANEESRLLDFLYQDKKITNSFYDYYYKCYMPKEYHKPIWKKFLNKLSRFLTGKNLLLYKEIESDQRVYF